VHNKHADVGAAAKSTNDCLTLMLLVLLLALTCKSVTPCATLQ
jgi:hypothetical protein